MVFEVFCRSHGCRVLLGPSCIESLRNTDAGPVLDWRCWCGTRGSLAHDRAGERGRPAPPMRVA